MATRTPRDASFQAIESPATPAPMIATSTVAGM
jgi:hypothetical protein